jgi:hypothetical protein
MGRLKMRFSVTWPIISGVLSLILFLLAILLDSAVLGLVAISLGLLTLAAVFRSSSDRLRRPASRWFSSGNVHQVFEGELSNLDSTARKVNDRENH